MASICKRMFWFLFYFNVSPAKWYNAGSKQPHEYCIRQSQSVNKRRRCVKFFMRSSFSTEEKQNIRAWSIWHVLLKVSANLPFSLLPHKQRQQQLTSSEVTFAQVNSTQPETNNLSLYTGRTRSSTCFIFYPLSAFNKISQNELRHWKKEPGNLYSSPAPFFNHLPLLNDGFSAQLHIFQQSYKVPVALRGTFSVFGVLNFPQ